VVGLSGPLFALKVLVILRSDRSALPSLIHVVMDALNIASRDWSFLPPAPAILEFTPDILQISDH
jgi:hypothetical protein